jgi:hypothetical protein
MSSPNYALNMDFVPKSLKTLLTKDEYEMVENVAVRRKAYNQMPLIAWTMGFLSIYDLDALLSY